MIDLHILHHPPATCDDWWAQCLESVADVARYGVTVHIVENPGTHIGAARMNAYRLGTQPYVACLDSDDVLMPEGIPAMLQVLKDNPQFCGVYSDRVQIDQAGRVLFRKPRAAWDARTQLHSRGAQYPHQFAIMRRDAVEPHLAAQAEFPVFSDFVLAGLVTHHGPWYYVPVLAYQRREKDYYRNHATPIPADIGRRAVQLVHPPLHKHIMDQLFQQSRVARHGH